jgi:gliding motility-associated-like protein
VASDPVAVSLSGQPCTTGGNTANTPPKIAEATIEIPVQTEKIVDVRSLITIGTVGVDYNTLRVTQDPPSGGKTFIDANFNLVLDYTSLQFVGKEIVGIQVCDSLNSCTQQSLNVDVIASIQAYNAISSEQDGKNDFFYLKYVDQIDDTKRNTVVIVDRWGNQVFSIQDYNNIDRVFRGQDNSGSELPTGIYFYRIDFASGRETQTGFISIKR